MNFKPEVENNDFNKFCILNVSTVPDRISYIKSHMIKFKIIKNALLSMTEYITSVQYPGASSVILL